MLLNKDDGITTVGFFSSGVSSAVAIKMNCHAIDKIVYTHIDDQHPDTMRFVKDCEEWFGKPIEIWQSPLKNVEAACLQYGTGYITGPHGANCTRVLKKRVRLDWEKTQRGVPLRYVWGFDHGERHRCIRAETAMPEQMHVFPLVDNEVKKEGAHKILNASGIKRPAMYDLGFNNNNCRGCVKGGMGYWNWIRVHFPEIFEARAKMERLVGASCCKETVVIHGEKVTRRVFLDELDPERGRHTPPIVEDCGIMCESIAL